MHMLEVQSYGWDQYLPGVTSQKYEEVTQCGGAKNSPTKPVSTPLLLLAKKYVDLRGKSQNGNRITISCLSFQTLDMHNL